MRRTCFDIVKTATEKDNITLIAASIMSSWFPRLSLTQSSPRCIIEDTFAHHFLDALLSDTFVSDPIYHQEWANGFFHATNPKR
ncbi:hypothetical protein DM01DRAFT_1171250 [Hesseltinella vesiculosa]|uniref:Uncharacterized protein n=1 Tax=Hesseltinella vesiculosa TaxID=101127 RepID=A0A1X2G6E5_9FUNG|nr:hypothetical protein DM01DRAFT_1171250 [Hesseltinella vesiculosa]